MTIIPLQQHLELVFKSHDLFPHYPTWYCSLKSMKESLKGKWSLRIRNEKKGGWNTKKKNKMEGIREVKKRIRKSYFTDIAIYCYICQF